ncbi:hypothetical protein D1953_04905 [Peribacillus asahii]|uniref:Uncharacterized protein n=1 Tax=Peribacillus asahii TaxID=228899 RepID=A0A398BJY6_9BACI|nr:hypothetical protein [Peribacillus asahii]RID87703.1 hypothetical protein D1953_04905 [Peribacillus asahii]
MESSQWLQGGPFLEVSFLLELKEAKTKGIQDIINKLSKVTNKIEIVDKNIDEIIDFFERGYTYDEEDPESICLHSLKLRLYVYLSKKRKTTLQIEKVSSNALMVNFWFFGSLFDAPEWDQIGIKEDEITDFTDFLMELFSVYKYKVGGIAIEEDILDLFDCNETYPNECYCYEKVSPDHFLQEPSHFINIVWNEKYKQINHIPYNHKRFDREGILIKTGSFND